MALPVKQAGVDYTANLQPDKVRPDPLPCVHQLRRRNLLRQTRHSPSNPGQTRHASTKPQHRRPPSHCRITTPQPQPHNHSPPLAAPPDWRTLCPIQVDFTTCKAPGGSQVASASINQGQQPVFWRELLAKKINTTTGEGAVTGRPGAPQADFERRP